MQKSGVNSFKEFIAQAKLIMPLYKEDIIGLVTKIIPIFILVILIYKTPKIIHSHFIAKLDTEAIGYLDDLKFYYGIKESEEGSKLIIRNFEVEYHYCYQNKLYSQVEVINAMSLGIKQNYTLKHLKIGDPIIVRFDSNERRGAKIKL